MKKFYSATLAQNATVQMALANCATKVCLLVVILLFTASISNSQTLSSSPSVGNWSSTSSTYSGCTSSANVIRATVTSINGSTVNFQIARVDGMAFQSSGYAYVCVSTPCGSTLTSGYYYAGNYSTNLSCSVSINPGSSMSVILTTVSTAGNKCHSGAITLTMSNVVSFNVSPSSTSVGSGSSSFTASIITLGYWSGSSNQSWCYLSPLSYGYNNSSVTVFCQTNTASYSRSATVTFSSQGQTKYLYVTQAGVVNIMVSPTSISFGINGGSQTVSVQTSGTAANISMSGSIPGLSVSASYISANMSYPLTVTCPANFGAARSATITIYGGGIYRYVYVSQSAGNCPINGQWFSQVNPSWANIYMCNYTIGAKGCAENCVEMLHASEITSSYPADPAQLNLYLLSNGGYSTCDIVWSVAANADGTGGLQYIGPDYTQNNWSYLDNELAQCHKVIVQVNGGAHWVLVFAKIGTTQTGSSYKVLDPGTSIYTVKTLANFSNTFLQSRSFAGNWGTSFAYREAEELAFDPSTFENKFYPNPVMTGNEIKYEIASNRLQTVSVRIFDITGRAVSDQVEYFGEGPNSGTLETPDKPGFYIAVFAFDDNTYFTRKFIVQ